MFSDVLSDAYHNILKNIDSEYSYQSIYPKNNVIKMLAQMRYLIMSSDSLLPDGTHTLSINEMKSKSLEIAKKDYSSRMKKKSSKQK